MHTHNLNFKTVFRFVEYVEVNWLIFFIKTASIGQLWVTVSNHSDKTEIL